MCGAKTGWLMVHPHNYVHTSLVPRSFPVSNCDSHCPGEVLRGSQNVAVALMLSSGSGSS